MANKNTTAADAGWVDVDTDFAPGWNPEPGDMLQGVLIRKDVTDNINFPQSVVLSKYGAGRYPIFTFRLTDSISGGTYKAGDQVAVHAFHQVLARILDDYSEGAELRLTYLGTEPHPRKAGLTMAAYRVQHRPQQVEQPPF